MKRKICVRQATETEQSHIGSVRKLTKKEGRPCLFASTFDNAGVGARAGFPFWCEHRKKRNALFGYRATGQLLVDTGALGVLQYTVPGYR